MARDFVGELFRQPFEVAPDAAPALYSLERNVRDVWGGERVYISKAPAERKAERLDETLANGQSLRQAVSEIGISRSHAYTLLRRKT